MMTLDVLISDFPKDKWDAHLTNHPIDVTQFSAKISKELCKEILVSIEENIQGKHYGKVINRFVLGLHIDKDYFLTIAKESGILRHSSYVNSRNPIFSVAELVLKNAAFYKISGEDKEYFTSLLNMDAFYHVLKEKYNILNTTVQKLHKSSLKSNRSPVRALLNFNEVNFKTDYDSDNTCHDLNDLKHFSKEAISESVSLIISLWQQNNGLTVRALGMTDYAFYKSSELRDLVLVGCQIKEFREFEILVEYFNYRCLAHTGYIEFVPPTEAFGKSYEMSLIMGHLQEISDNIRLQDEIKHLQSFKDMVDLFLHAFKNVFELKTTPFRRYRFEIPDELFRLVCRPDEVIFKESAILIESIQKELLIPYEEFKTFTISKNMTFQQFLKLFMAFMLFEEITSRHLLPKLESEEEAVLNSMCPVLKLDMVNILLGRVESDETIKEFMDIVTWKSGVDSYLDLQYKPIIFVDGYYCVSPSLFIKSRLYRNIFITEAKKGNRLMASKNAEYDKLVSNAIQALKYAGFEVKQDVPIKYKTTTRNESDIDILAVKDDLMLIIECKDSVNPVDPFELRTSFKHIKNAAEQLQYSCEVLTDETFKAGFAKNQKLDLSKVKVIMPFILTSNKSFWGFDMQGIPIRNIHEFMGFIGHGEWLFKLPGEEKQVYSLWHSGKMETDDMKNFLDQKLSPHFLFLDAMVPYHLDYKGEIKFRKDAYDAAQGIANMKSNYRRIPQN
jgi:hypothetical protein